MIGWCQCGKAEEKGGSSSQCEKLRQNGHAAQKSASPQIFGALHPGVWRTPAGMTLKTVPRVLPPPLVVVP